MPAFTTDPRLTRRCPKCGRCYPGEFAFCPDDGEDLVPHEVGAAPGKLPASTKLLVGLLIAILAGAGGFSLYAGTHRHEPSRAALIPTRNAQSLSAPEARSVLSPPAPVLFRGTGVPMLPRQTQPPHAAVLSDGASSGEYRLTVADMRGKSDRDLTLMRNEIYARHGYLFAHPDLLHYFQQQPWYRPDSRDQNVVMHRMSLTERANADFILAYQKNGHFPLGNPPRH